MTHCSLTDAADWRYSQTQQEEQPTCTLRTRESQIYGL
jgi:hypothetical protein